MKRVFSKRVLWKFVSHQIGEVLDQTGPSPPEPVSFDVLGCRALYALTDGGNLFLQKGPGLKIS